MTRFGRLLPAVAAALAACGSSSGHTAAPASTTASTRVAQIPGSAKIELLVVPASVKCESGTRVPVPVRYSVAGARTRQIIIDGLLEPGRTPARGRAVVRIRCDGLQHTVSLVALDAAGHRTSRVKFVTTDP